MDRQFLRYPGFKRKALTLSYDDGVRQDKKLISIMQKNGLKGTFNINGGMFGSEYSGVEVGRMTIEEAVELYNSSGMEVAIHGFKHLSLAKVDSAIAVNDVIKDRVELEKIFGRIIKGMAYANGSYDDDVVDILKKCGVNYSRTVVSTEKFELPTDWLKLPATAHHNNPRLMELAEQFVNLPKGRHFWYDPPKLFYLWGHSYEFDNNQNWNVIEEFAEFMGGREDIWYATNGEIFDYVTAFDRLEYNAEGTIIHNPSAIDLYLSYKDKEVLIRAGETVKV
ncbi:MAG: polysaccharide deacetylase [Clostridiales bacterium]|nr:polysaccharide deacetylase [Clostridiales bacterium]